MYIIQLVFGYESIYDYYFGVVLDSYISYTRSLQKQSGIGEGTLSKRSYEHGNVFPGIYNVTYGIKNIGFVIRLCEAKREGVGVRIQM